MTNSHKNNMVISLISAEPLRAAKALRFGRKFLAAGWSVSLSLSVEGVGLVDASHASAHCPVTGRFLTDLLKDFLAEGGRALVGAECMKLEGVPAESLPAGVEIATFEVLEGLLLLENTRTLTW